MASFEISHSIKTSLQQQLQENLSAVYMTEIENQPTTVKSATLENRKKQEVYIEEDDLGQCCISIR